MRRTLPLFFLLFLFAFLARQAAAVASASPLVKASTAAVYFIGTDAKRYVFPNEKTYATWYKDFSQVRTISDAELASYPIGGTVTYQPGSRMLKLTTDPKVYAIEGPRTLRPIQDESIARALYGNTWTYLVDDLPDAFFTQYTLGPSIVDTSWNAATQSTLFPTIHALFKVDPWSIVPANPPASSAPSAAPSHVATIASSKGRASPDEKITLTADAIPRTDVQAVNIFFDGTVLQACERAPCSVDLTLPRANVPPAYAMRTEITWGSGAFAKATGTVVTDLEASGLVAVRLTNDQVRSGGRREIIVQVDANFSASAIDLYMDGVLFKGCNSTQECRSSSVETASVGTTHTIHAIAKNAAGQELKSRSQTLVVVTNEHPMINLLVGKDVLLKGETVDVSATAADDDGIASVELYADGTLLKRCEAIRCDAIIGPWDASRSVLLTARATDTAGAVAETPSTAISIR